MIKIDIRELGNNKIGFYVFNEYNQQLSFLNKTMDKIKKQKYLDKLRKKFMLEGQSVSVDDNCY